MIKLFKRKTDEQKISDSIQQYIDILEKFDDENSKKPLLERELLPPPTNPQLAFNCLIETFLGEDWYTAAPINSEQINTMALDRILYENNKQYRKYCNEKKKGE